MNYILNVNKLIILLSMILLLTGCSESKQLSTNQSEDNNQIKYKSKDITINENLLKKYKKDIVKCTKLWIRWRDRIFRIYK